MIIKSKGLKNEAIHLRKGKKRRLEEYLIAERISICYNNSGKTEIRQSSTGCLFFYRLVN